MSFQDSAVVARIEYRLNEWPEECLDCVKAACTDGLIYGYDGDGCETSDNCQCRCHVSDDDIAAEEGDREYERRKEEKDLYGK